MKKFLKWLSIVIIFLVGVFVIGGIMLPSRWKVEESIVINAPKERIYEQVANLRNWQNWSPWNKEMDPTQVYTYEGPEIGEDAKWLWTSEKMGVGWLMIKDADEDRGIDYDLFIDMNGSQSTINGRIAYASVDGAQKIVWTDEGDSGSSLVKRWFALLIKQMLSKEMRSGLSKLKLITEAE